jgi:restriction system protein
MRMTDVEIPTYRDLMYPTLVAVEKLGGSAAISELEEEVPKIAGVTDGQMAVVFPDPSPLAGTSKVINRLHWARSYLKKIGALNNSTRGVWAISSTGSEFLAMEPDAADEALKQADNQVRAEMRKAKAEELAEEDEEVDEAESDWKDNLLAKLKSMDPIAFERLSMRLLREARWPHSSTGRSNSRRWRCC